MSISQVSVVIMAKNAEDTIEETLSALQGFDDVVLYLNNSTDTTESIARQYENVTVIQGEFLGFGPTKNKAAQFSKNDWILSLDSDEILNVTLVNEIEKLDFTDETVLYKFKRNNYFLGYKTQDSDYLIRLYHKMYTQFNDNVVHEKVIILPDAKIIQLNTSFKHLNITHINQTLTKIIQYTDLSESDKKTCFFGTVIAKSLFAFIKIYIFKGNIFRGWVGLALAINAGNRRYYKYIKQFLKCKGI